MRVKLKAVLILTAIVLFALTLHRIGFFDDPGSFKRLAGILFPAPVKYNLMIVGIYLPLFVAWRIIRNKFNGSR